MLTAETVGQLICMTLVAALLIRPRWEWLIPGVVGLCITGFIMILGPLSGGSVNPARQFGPALWAGNFGFLTAYLIGPVLGAALAAALAAALKPPVEPPAVEEAALQVEHTVRPVEATVCPDTIPPELLRERSAHEDPYRI